ncbi:Uncharacterised protein [Mycobacteroides abscessus subsp. abscessus]|nr:Uncharacterised protein [Mycobacteroides abscessus subsp. abscessus]
MIEVDDLTMTDVHRIESTHPTELDAIVASPPLRVGDPQPDFLSAHQCGPHRDSDDAAAAGEVHRGEHTGIAHACDDDASRPPLVDERHCCTHPGRPTPSVVRELSRGSGRNFGTRSMTSA